MSTQTVGLRIAHKNACSLDPVRVSLTSRPTEQRRQPLIDLGTSAPSSKDSYKQINDFEMLSRICAASKVVLQFIRALNPGIQNSRW